jgi:phenylacetate-CoA ligase
VLNRPLTDDARGVDGESAGYRMTSIAAGGVDRLLRSTAYDVLCRRDRLSGWKGHRRAVLADSQRCPDELARSAESKLRNILRHAYETTPFYRESWDAAGFRPSDTTTAEDLTRLPFLTKDIIREQKPRLVSSRFRPDELDLSYTGGTTGTQTAFHLDHACAVARLGRQWGILELCGFRPGDRRGLVWGVHADLPPENLGGSLKRWFRQYASAQEVLRCTLMSKELLAEYHARLLRFRPSVLYGYPSALVELGTFIEERRLEPIAVKSILTTAERLSSVQRQFLERNFRGTVFNLYCTREYGCLGFECHKHQGLHIDSGSVLVEITHEDRRVEAGQTGEITVTDLLNYGMPFVRSRTGDSAALATRPCECGSPLPLLTSFDGRATDLIYRPDGSVVPGLMFCDLFMDLPSIRFAQFVQEKPRELNVYVVVTADHSGAADERAIAQVQELVGRDMLVHLKRVPEITRTERSGKFREVICTIGRPRAVGTL